MEPQSRRCATPPGLYVRQGRERALNHAITANDLTAMNSSVGGASVQPYTEAPRTDLAPLLFALAALVFLLDTLATLWLGGGWKRAATVTAACPSFSSAMPHLNPAQAQTT